MWVHVPLKQEDQSVKRVIRAGVDNLLASILGVQTV